ncbi:uncharacterized protein LOC123542528 [Mercenaria mercenaria]|uniref:uncharacterized protein LOC123542528 n=1 Tax=Mercenaria mercenaria TaxID=6596 RepID=UPI00234ED21A|nr:uncharacterized protein LOC123542528 [Mercenaria mercenaria]
MAVSGRKVLSTTVCVGSEEDIILYCHPCELSGQTVNANGYCQDCKTSLCDSCITSHKNATQSGNNVINRSFMQSSISVSSDKLQNCPTHEAEEVKLYCRAHETFGCVICMTLSHKQCEIDYIPEVSEQFLKGYEYLSLETNLDNLKERCAVGLSKIEANIIDIETAYANVISEVESTRKQIIEELDKFENELKEEVTECRKKNLETMETLKKTYESVAKYIVDTEATIGRMRKDEKYNIHFCEVKKAFAKILEYQSQVYEVSTRLCKQECEFQKSTELNTFLTKESLLGTIHVKDTELGPCNTPETLSTQPVGHINIKSKDDKKTCYATGLAFMSSNQLAIADKANKNVKIVDVSYNKMISEIGLSSSPRDITVIPPDQLAVTLRDEEMIQLLSTAKGLKKTEQIKTVGKCRGIKYDNGKLIVAYDSAVRPKIEILRLNGDVLCTFQFIESGTVLVNEPKCIDLSPDHNQMYVTDLTKMCVLRLSRLGNATGTFGRHRFMGVAVSPGGSVYTSSKSSSTVYQLSDDMSKVETVLTTADGIKEPIALVFSKTRNMLYVSCGSTDANVSNKLHVFKTKYENAGVV